MDPSTKTEAVRLVRENVVLDAERRIVTDVEGYILVEHHWSDGTTSRVLAASVDHTKERRAA